MMALRGDSGKQRVMRKRGRAAQPQTHSSATTTPRVRRAIQLSEEKNIALAKRFGVSRKTIAKWKALRFYVRRANGPKNPCSSVLTQDDEAIILAYCWRTRLPLNDCLDKLRHLMPKLSRSALYRCLKRRGLGRIGSTASSPPLTSAGLKGPYRFEITAIEIVFRDDILEIVLFRCSSRSKMLRNTFMRRSLAIRRKTPLRFSPIWSLSFRKGSSR